MTQTANNRFWIARGGWALADQACFAFANVLLNVLLANWLSPGQFGAFAVAYSIFLFFGAIHTALLTEPMLVFGASRYANQTGTYLRSLLKGHWTITGIGSLLMFLAAILFRLAGHQDLAQALFGLALATPFSLLTWFGRRTAYLQAKPHQAAFLSLSYCLFVVVGLLALAQLNRLSLFSAFVVVAISGALSCLPLLLKLNRGNDDQVIKTDNTVSLCTSVSLRLRGDFYVGFNSPLRHRGTEVRREDLQQSVAITHWQYGRWAIANGLLMWVPLNFFFVVLSIAVNFEASATLKAISNLVLPLLQANAAFATLLLPAMTARATNSEQFNQWLVRSLTYFTAMAIAYAAMLAMFGSSLVHTLYGGKYDGQINLLWFLLLVPILDGMTVVFSTAARAQERPDRIFWSQLATALFVLTAGVIATRMFGVIGAGATIVAGNFIGLTILVVSYYSASSVSAFRKPLPSAN